MLDFFLITKNGEIPRRVSKSSKGETFGFVPAGRRGVFGAAGVGLVGKFLSILF